MAKLQICLYVRISMQTACMPVASSVWPRLYLIHVCAYRYSRSSRVLIAYHCIKSDRTYISGSNMGLVIPVCHHKVPDSQGGTCLKQQLKAKVPVLSGFSNGSVYVANQDERYPRILWIMWLPWGPFNQLHVGNRSHWSWHSGYLSGILHGGPSR